MEAPSLYETSADFNHTKRTVISTQNVKHLILLLRWCFQLIGINLTFYVSGYLWIVDRVRSLKEFSLSRNANKLFFLISTFISNFYFSHVTYEIYCDHVTVFEYTGFFSRGTQVSSLQP